MSNYSAVSLNGVNLKITSITPVRVQKTRNYAIGKSLVKAPIIGLSDQQWELRLEGTMTGTTSTNLATNRASLEALDSATSYTYTDGIHNGNFYVEPGSLTFTDDQDSAGVGTHYKYSLVLVQA